MEYFQPSFEVSGSDSNCWIWIRLLCRQSFEVSETRFFLLIGSLSRWYSDQHNARRRLLLRSIPSPYSFFAFSPRLWLVCNLCHFRWKFGLIGLLLLLLRLHHLGRVCGVEKTHRAVVLIRNHNKNKPMEERFSEALALHPRNRNKQLVEMILETLVLHPRNHKMNKLMVNSTQNQPYPMSRSL